MIQMREKTTQVLIVLFVASIILISGCVQQIRKFSRDKGSQCKDIEKELKEKEGINCKCIPTDFVPKNFRNKTGIEGQCFCMCQTQKGNRTNVSVARTKEGNYIISRLTS